MTLADIIAELVPKSMLPDGIVRRQYVRSGLAFYDLEHTLIRDEQYNHMANAEYRRALARFAMWEREYAHRGYRTESPSTLAIWREHGLLGALGNRCAAKEKPRLYAKRYLHLCIENNQQDMPLLANNTT